MALRPLVAAFVASWLLVAACSSGGAPVATPSSTAAPGATSAPSDGPATPSGTPTTGELPRFSDVLQFAPLEAEIPPEDSARGFAIFDASQSVLNTLAEPQIVPEPIDFRAGALLTRAGDIFPLLDAERGEIARARAYGPHPSTDRDAPGARAEDFDVSPTLEHFVSRRFANDGATYELVLIEAASSEETVVAEGRELCQCDAYRLGRWSASGRFFADAAVNDVLLVDVEGTARVLPADWEPIIRAGDVVVWAPAADEFLVRLPDGVWLVDAITLERTQLSTEDAVPSFLADGSHIVLVSGNRDAPLSTLIDRTTSEPVLEVSGRVLAAAIVDGRPLVAIADAADCDGVLLTGGRDQSICFQEAHAAALAADGSALSLAFRQVTPIAGSAGAVETTWHVETYTPLGRLRATILGGPFDTSSGEIFMLWNEDGSTLAIYWPWNFGP